jgi:hypothetical protein
VENNSIYDLMILDLRFLRQKQQIKESYDGSIYGFEGKLLPVTKTICTDFIARNSGKPATTVFLTPILLARFQQLIFCCQFFWHVNLPHFFITNSIGIKNTTIFLMPILLAGFYNLLLACQ